MHVVKTLSKVMIALLCSGCSLIARFDPDAQRPPADGDSDTGPGCSDAPWFEAAGFALTLEQALPDPLTTGIDFELGDGEHVVNTTNCDARVRIPDEIRYAGLGTLDERTVCVYIVRDLTVLHNRRLLIHGDHPLVVIAGGSINIEGHILSTGCSFVNDQDECQPGAGGGRGAPATGNAEPAVGLGCETDAEGGAGVSIVFLPNGGGGGAGSGSGGNGGGSGGINNSQRGGDAASCERDRPHLLGGAGGGRGGGVSSSGNVESLGGDGGGALSFTAAEIIIASGASIDVSGARGGSGNSDLGSCGGGGGGTIVLDAPVMTVDGRLGARGGNGGELILSDEEQVSGASGGDGESLDGEDGGVHEVSALERVGLGGGGGAGAIFIRTRPRGATISAGAITPWLPEWQFEDRCEQ
jgi:hypothetical protein